MFDLKKSTCWIQIQNDPNGLSTCGIERTLPYHQTWMTNMLDGTYFIGRHKISFWSAQEVFKFSSPLLVWYIMCSVLVFLITIVTNNVLFRIWKFNFERNLHHIVPINKSHLIARIWLVSGCTIVETLKYKKNND